MDILTKAIACREKVEILGKIFVLKNNQTEAVLFSLNEYERLSVFIEYLKSLEIKDIAKFTRLCQRKEVRKNTGAVDWGRRKRIE